MTVRYRFSESDLINIGGTRYRSLGTDDYGALLECVGQPGITEKMSHDTLAEIFKRTDVRYIPGYFERAWQDAHAQSPVEMVNELPQRVQHKTLWKEAFCKAFLSLHLNGSLKRTAASYKLKARIAAEVNRLTGEGEYFKLATRPGDEVVSRRLPGSRTALDMVRQYERGGFSILALIPKTYCSGNRKPRWCHRSEALMTRVIEIYASTQRPTKVRAIADTLRLFRVENERRFEAGQNLLVIPSAETIRRRLALADPYYVYAKRFGTAAANAKFTLFETGPDVERPLERVEMDECKLDVISIFTMTEIWDHLSAERQRQLERSRRWIYAAIDCATRCVLSLRVATTPNADDAVRALRDIYMDKTSASLAAECETSWHHHGGIGCLVTDNGPAFTSDYFKATVSSLAITSHFPPAGKPWLRPYIESLFRTFGHQLMPMLSGRTFFSAMERGDYPSEQLACLCDDDLIKVLLTYVVDIYHNQPHGSLGGETPNDAWTRLVAKHGVPPVPDGLTLRRAFGRSLERKIQGDGVAVFGLTYNCEALREAFLHSPKRKVEIRADLKDLGWVAVKIGANWYPAIANQRGFDGVSYDELTEATRSLRMTHKKNAELAAPTIHRAIERISETNRQAFLIRELTPFHVTDSDVERNQRALHYPVRSDAERLGQVVPSADPLADGITISPAVHKDQQPAIQSRSTASTRTCKRRTGWDFDDEE